MSGLPINNVAPFPSVTPPHQPTGDDNATITGVHNIKCTSIDLHYNIIATVMCGMYLIFGVVYSLFGYRCFKAIMFLTGFICASAVVYLICLEEDLLPVGGNAGVAIGAGILFGLITMLVQYVGLFVTGLHSGLLIGITALAIMHIFYIPHTMWISGGVLIGCALIFAIATLCWQKSLTIFGTSLYGGAIICVSIDYFIEKFQMVYWFCDRIRILPPSDDLCWFSWVIVALWPVLVTTGLCTQWRVTGKGIHHQRFSPPSKSQQLNLQKIRERNDRAEQKQKKYRYLYQVRTAHGDVISQSYIQWLQDKACTSEKLESSPIANSDVPGQTAPLNPSDTSITSLSQMP
ncbi:Transmembrane protein 198 [Nymphon striatum]|nr:Transmembrane protein 198 [Nymphon striatum]